MCRFGVAVTALRASTKLLATSGPVSTEKDDRLRVGISPWLTQPPTLSGTGNEYRPSVVMLRGWR